MARSARAIPGAFLKVPSPKAARPLKWKRKMKPLKDKLKPLKKNRRAYGTPRHP
jgi:hypothetical protein